jgi:hypothetical protein
MRLNLILKLWSVHNWWYQTCLLLEKAGVPTNRSTKYFIKWQGIEKAFASNPPILGKERTTMYSSNPSLCCCTWIIHYVIQVTNVNTVVMSFDQIMGNIIRNQIFYFLGLIIDKCINVSMSWPEKTTKHQSNTRFSFEFWDETSCMVVDFVFILESYCSIRQKLQQLVPVLS